TDHPRAGWRPHGERSQDVGAQCQLPGARLQESLRRRWRTVRDAGRQESDVDDSCAGVAYLGLHRAAAQAWSPMSDETKPAPSDDGASIEPSPSAATPVSRRAALKVLGAVPAA